MIAKNLYPSMVETFLRKPTQKANQKSDVLTKALSVMAGTLLIIISAKIYIPLPFTPVPITAQTLSILFVGSMLGASLAPISVILYLLLGAVGLPVYAESVSGIQYLLGPTAGYLFGFIFASYFVGKFSEKGWDRTFLKSLPIMLVGQLLVFVPGLLWLATFVGFENVLEKGFYPFIIGGLVKTLLAGTSAMLAWNIIARVKGELNGKSN